MERLGRYEIQSELGRGAMGTVFQARDPKIDRIVAIKTIALFGISPEEEQEYRERFFREAQAAGRLTHPGIVTIHDVGEEETTQAPYIVMEHISGQTLENLAKGSEERLPQETTLDLVKQIAEALDYAHAQGIVHRDIKPANIIVTPEGRAKITDFGIAKLALTQFTMPGQMLGTPSYMSPEQLSGGSVDGRSDLFSLGVILYWLLTGEKPFPGDTTTSVTFKIAYTDPVPVSRLNPSLRTDFDYVVARVLAKDPARRYQRGKEFAEDLEEIRQGRTPRSRNGSLSRSESEVERTVIQRPLESVPVVPAGVGVPLRAGRRILEYAKRLPFPGKADLATGWGHAAEFAKRLPREAQVGIAVVVIFLALLALRSAGPAGTAMLHITSKHNFRAADLFVSVDDELVYTTKLIGVARRRIGLFKNVQGSFSSAVDLSAGKHYIQVHVVAPDEGYDQTKQIEGEFVQDGERTLEIGFRRQSRDLYLAWR